MTKPQLITAFPLLPLLLLLFLADSGTSASRILGHVIRVRGRIELNPRAILPPNARLVVRLKDVSQVDEPSKLLARKTFESIDTTFNANGNIPFVIKAMVPIATPFGPNSVVVSGTVKGDGVSYITGTLFFVDLKSGTFEYKNMVMTLVKYP